MYFLVLLTTALSQNPAYPQWNNVWMVNFTEDTNRMPDGPQSVSGVWYYNASLGVSRMDRSSGRYDHFCGLNEWFSFFDTPCTHLVNSGIRYLYYPDLQICCNCCSDSDGCGILNPNWLNNSEFLGEFQYNDTITAYLWNQMGNSPNFYWETNDTLPLNRQMLELDNGGFDDRFLIPENRSTSFTSSVFNVPTYCQSSFLCDSNSLCAQVRGSGGKSEHLKHLKN